MAYEEAIAKIVLQDQIERAARQTRTNLQLAYSKSVELSDLLRGLGDTRGANHNDVMSRYLMAQIQDLEEASARGGQSLLHRLDRQEKLPKTGKEEG